MSSDDRPRRTLSRRRVLAGTGATLGGAFVAGVAGAQETTTDGGGATTDANATTTEERPLEEIIYEAVFLESERWETSALEGFFLHVGGSVDPINAQVADECNYTDWQSPTQAYDVTLINNDNLDAMESNTLYLSGEASIRSGALFHILSVQQCSSGYLGARVKLVGNRQFTGGPAQAGVTPGAGGANGGEDGGNGGDQTAAQGPGFGVLAGLGSLLGAGAVARWLRRRE